MLELQTRPRDPERTLRTLVALLCAALLIPGEGVLFAQASPAAAPAGTAEKAPPPIPPAQLDSLVAPIALYSDPLLAQTLVAATYPLEIIQLQQWLLKNKGLKDKALTDAVAKQPWDPAIQSMAAFPDAVKRLADDISWTTDLGNAFLAQQKDVMDAVQRMRKKAMDKGALKTNEQQKVETKVVETQTVIIVEPANPTVIYVPVYSPTVVYPPPVYPYPPIYYPPPPPPGAAFMTFTAGVMIGAAFSNGSCCNCGWGGSNNVNINVNNNYYKNTNVNTGGNNSWQHNSAHRGGTPYPNSATASKYSGSGAGASANSRQAGAQQQAGRQGGAGASPSATTQGSRGGAGASPSAGTQARGGGGAGSSPGASTAGAGGAAKSSGAFGGGSGGFSGASASASSARGASSMSSRSGGGGGSRGGGRR